MKSVVKNKNTPVVAEEKERSAKTAGSSIVVSAINIPSKIDSRAWEVADQMKLLWRMIKHGYGTAFKLSDSDEEVFIKARKNKSKEELLEEYYNLNKSLQSSL